MHTNYSDTLVSDAPQRGVTLAVRMAVRTAVQMAVWTVGVFDDRRC